METNSIMVRDSFVVNALRNCGYNNYAAIADIIDNSIEPNVNASKVEITLETAGRGEPISTIVIADDGSGMPYDILKEALCLGSMTGKTGTSNLGMYGTGLKTAALSIGQKLTVYTLHEDATDGSVATLDITDAALNQGGVKVTLDTVSAQAVKDLLPEDAKSGTAVKIEAIDRLSNTDRKSFGGYLRAKLGEIFGKYIFTSTFKLFVDRHEVQPVNPMINPNGISELLGQGSFSVDGHSFSYTAYFLPKDGSEDALGEGNARNSYNQGIYIYRQSRLVGRALTLGLWKRHPSLNGLRVELLMDGTNDTMLGASFTKIISERSSETMSQAIKDTLAKELGPYIMEVKHRSLAEAAMSRASTDPETLKMYDNVVQEQNGNLLLRVNRRGENKPRNEPPKEHEPRGPQKHPNPTRERRKRWLDGIQEASLGIGEDMYKFQIANNKTIVIINTDHPFYTELYKSLPIELKYKMAQVITCHQIAKSNVNYYGSEFVQETIDNYDSVLSSEVRKSLKK